MAKIKVRLVRSKSKQLTTHRLVLESLGLNKIGSERIHDDSPTILGMARKVRHMVVVTKIEG